MCDAHVHMLQGGTHERGMPSLCHVLQLVSAAAEAVMCDSVEASDMKVLAGARPFTCILHTAGAGGMGLIVHIDARKMRWMHSSKAVGAWHLHCSAATASLEACVIFSSAAALGYVKQASYAASNTSADAHALARRVDGVAACKEYLHLARQEQREQQLKEDHQGDEMLSTLTSNSMKSTLMSMSTST